MTHNRPILHLSSDDGPGPLRATALSGPESGAPRPRFLHINPLADPAHLASALAEPGAGPVCVWSGTLADPEEGLFARDPRTWMPAGLDALDGTVRGVLDKADATGDHGRPALLLRPHARHVLCDPQRCLTLLDRWADLPVGLALDASAMLEPSMLGAVEDHLARALEALGHHAAAVFLTDLRPADPDEADAGFVPVPLGAGELAPILDRYAELVDAHAPADAPVVLLGPDPEGQLARLRAGR